MLILSAPAENTATASSSVRMPPPTVKGMNNWRAAQRTVSSRVARRRNRKVAEIVAAAADVLAERGYHDTSLDEIADRLDLAKATLYHYFPSKESLVMACMEAVGTEVIQQLREAFPYDLVRGI